MYIVVMRHAMYDHTRNWETVHAFDTEEAAKLFAATFTGEYEEYKSAATYIARVIK